MHRGTPRPASDAAKTASLLRLAFGGFLGFCTAVIALGGTFYSLLLFVVCVTPWLVGFVIVYLMHRRIDALTSEILRLTIDHGGICHSMVLKGAVELHVRRALRFRSSELRIWGGEEVDTLESDGEATYRIFASR